MRRACPPLLRLFAGAALALPLSAFAQPQSAAPGLASYRLIEPAVLPSLMPGTASRWLIETATGLGEHQELRLAARASHPAWPHDAAFGLSPSLETRATWRYAILERPNWVWRLGLTSLLGGGDAHGSYAARSALGARPMLHVAGEGSLSKRWQFSFAADSPLGTRRPGLDLGLRVSYQLAPNFSLIGAYRLSDNGIDGEDLYPPGLTNSANVGLRLRF